MGSGECGSRSFTCLLAKGGLSRERDGMEGKGERGGGRGERGGEGGWL